MMIVGWHADELASNLHKMMPWKSTCSHGQAKEGWQDLAGVHAGCNKEHWHKVCPFLQHRPGLDLMFNQPNA